MKKKKKLKKDNIIIFIVIIVSIIGIAISLNKVLNYNKDTKEEKKLIKEAQEIVTSTVIEDNPETTEIVNEVKEEDPYFDYIKTKLIDVNFEELKSINNEVAGWITIDNTNINYPYVKTTDNDYYMNHTFNKSYNGNGWIFLDYRNNVDLTDKNNIIYGHSLINKSMFGTLRNTLKADWYNNKQNHMIKISTEKSSSLWQVFSVYHLPTTTDYLITNFSSDEEYAKFLNMVKGRSAYSFETTVSTTDKILTLSTCYSETERNVVHAKLVKINYKN